MKKIKKELSVKLSKKESAIPCDVVAKQPIKRKSPASKDTGGDKLMSFFDNFKLTSLVTIKSYHVLHKSITAPCVEKNARAIVAIMPRKGKAMDVIVEGESVAVPMRIMNNGDIDSAILSMSSYLDGNGKLNAPWKLQVYKRGDMFSMFLMEIL